MSQDKITQIIDSIDNLTNIIENYDNNQLQDKNSINKLIMRLVLLDRRISIHSDDNTQLTEEVNEKIYHLNEKIKNIVIHNQKMFKNNTKLQELKNFSDLDKYCNINTDKNDSDDDSDSDYLVDTPPKEPTITKFKTKPLKIPSIKTTSTAESGLLAPDSVFVVNKYSDTKLSKNNVSPKKTQDISFDVLYAKILNDDNKIYDIYTHYKDKIFSTMYIDSNYNTILGKCIIDNKTDMVKELLSSEYCTKTYLSYRMGESDYDSISLLIKTIPTFIDTMLEIPNTELILYLTEKMEYYMFMLLAIKRYDELEKYCNIYFTRDPVLIFKLCIVVESGISSGFDNYSVLTYLLDNLRYDYCSNIIINMQTTTWFKNSLYVIYNELAQTNNISSIIILTSILNNSNKLELVAKLIENKEYEKYKYVKNLICDILIEDKTIPTLGIKRLLFLIEHGNKMQIENLLTNSQFLEYEFYEKENGLNCVFKAIVYNPDIINTLISCDYFKSSLVSDKDDSNLDIIYYIKTYAPKHKQMLNLYKIYFPESNDVTDTMFQQGIVCKICAAKEVNIRFDPCGHVICSQCISERISTCPYCSTTIDNFQHMIFP